MTPNMLGTPTHLQDKNYHYEHAKSLTLLSSREKTVQGLGSFGKFGGRR